MELSRLGIKTTLIIGPTNLNFDKNLSIKKVTSGKEMLRKVQKTLPVDIAVCTGCQYLILNL